MNAAKPLSILLLATLVGGCAPADDDATPTTADDAELREVRCEALSTVPGMTTTRLDADEGRVHLRVGVFPAKGLPKGDVFYLPGFADRLDNHLPLFEAWSKAGLRVVSFDYPSHGESCGRPLDRYGFEDLGRFADAVERHTREDATRPFVLSGWSTGGLVAVRTLQEGWLGRAVKGVVLFAPAVAPRAIIGEAGFVTEGTLTRNPSPPHRGPITPKTPLATPLFAPKLLLNGALARHTHYPTVPTLVVLGGDDTDRYVDIRGVDAWMRDVERDGGRIEGRRCAGGFHELDNEPAPMGPAVRSATSDFAGWIVAGAREKMPASVTGDDGACSAW